MLYEITVVRSGTINEPPVPQNLERVVFYIEAKDAGEAEARVVSILSDGHLLWEIHRTFVNLSEIEPSIRPEPARYPHAHINSKKGATK